MATEIILATLMSLAAAASVIAGPLLITKMRESTYRRTYTAEAQRQTRPVPVLPKYAPRSMNVEEAPSVAHATQRVPGPSCTH